MDDDDPIPLSALQHHLYCPRQCALIHVERQWEENRFTAEGRLLHDRVDAGGAERRGREQRDEGGDRSSTNDYGHTPSSMALLQLSSIPLQTSARGSTSPAQPDDHAPAAQTWVPPRHRPTLIVPPGPL